MQALLFSNDSEDLQSGLEERSADALLFHGGIDLLKNQTLSSEEYCSLACKLLVYSYEPM